MASRLGSFHTFFVLYSNWFGFTCEKELMFCVNFLYNHGLESGKEWPLYLLDIKIFVLIFKRRCKGIMEQPTSFIVY